MLQHFYIFSLFVLLLVTPARTQIQLIPYKAEQEYWTLTEKGKLEKRESEFSADSGSIYVPENRDSQQSPRIRIQIVRFHSTQPSQNPPVFWLSGGPGQTNLSSFRYDYFIAGHDHVMVGYRGVDGDVSLDCPEVVEVLEDAGDILDPEVIRGVSNAYGSCAQRLLSSGVDINGYTPLAVAEDIEDVRQALGYESIDIVAESYGTRVAFLYAVKFPERVHRLIMIGSNPPGCMVWDPAVNDSLLANYDLLWKKDPLSKDLPSLRDAFKKVNGDFPKKWLFFPIHEGTVKASVNAFLFHRGTAAQAIDAYVAAADGDASGLWFFSVAGSWIFPTIVNWGDNASKAMSADFDSTRDYLKELNPPGVLIGAPLGAFLWGPTLAKTWPIALIPDQFRRSQKCTVQTLFLSGSLDFSTPAKNVDTFLLPNFPNGSHVVLYEAGHVLDLWRSQPAATHRLLRKFLDSGAIDTSLVRYTPVLFEASPSFPSLAKLAVVGIVVASGLVVWLAWCGLPKIF